MSRILKLVFVISVILGATACRDEYQDARDQCARDYPKTVDYIQCVNAVNARQQSDEDDAVILSTTISAATISSTM